MIFERQALIYDEEIRFSSFPVIHDNDEVPFLLIYDASERLHDINLKDLIVNFLKQRNSKFIESYIYSCIHFRLKEEEHMGVVLQSLNNDFASFVIEIEKKHGGKMFWLFQQITRYQNDKELHASMLGRGNKTLNDNLNKSTTLLKS